MIYKKLIFILIILLLLIPPVLAYNGTYAVSSYQGGNITRTSVNTTVAENVSNIRTRAGTAVDLTSLTSSTGVTISSTAIGNPVGVENLSTMYRGALTFDMRSIPRNATIVNATLILYMTEKRTALGSPDIVITNFSPLDPTNFVSGDYVRVMNGSGIPEYSTRITNSSWTSGTNKSIYLNAAGLAALNATRNGGTLKTFNISLRTAWDVDNTTSGIRWQPNEGAVYTFASRESATYVNDPILIVNYTLSDTITSTPYNDTFKLVPMTDGNTTRTSDNAAAVGENMSRVRNWSGTAINYIDNDMLVGVMRSASITAPNANNVTAQSRGYMTYDVGKLPENATVINVTLILHLKTKITTLGSPDIIITNGSPLDPTNFVSGDYVRVPNISANTPVYADRITNSSWTIGQNKSIFLNATGIAALNASRSGIGLFNISIRTAWDVDNSTTGMSVVATTLRSATYTFGTRESVSPIEDPILIINYTLPEGGGASNYNETYTGRVYRDGNVTRTSVNTTVAENVSNIRTRAGTAIDQTSTAFTIGTKTSSTVIGFKNENLSTMHRAFFDFNGAEIPNNATIVNATLVIYLANKRTALGSPDIVLSNATPLDPTNYVSGDYVRVMNGSGIPEYSTRITNASWTIGTNKSIYLNADGIAALNATRTGGGFGLFNLSFRTAWDIDNTTPGILWQRDRTMYDFATREAVLSWQDPMLIINYSMPDPPAVPQSYYNESMKILTRFTGNSTRTSENAAAVGENFSRSRNWTGGLLDNSSTDLLVGVMRSASITAPNANNITANARGETTFNVGEIPINATIVNSTLVLYLKTKITTLGSPDIVITNATPLDPTLYTGSDYVAKFPNISANTPVYADRITNSSWTIGQNKSIFLNSVGLTALNNSRSGSGMFNITIRTAWDVDNSTTGMSVAATTLRSATYTFGSSRSVNFIEDPILIVNYTLPSSEGGSGIIIPNASYIINKSFGTEPQDVQFNDTSTGSPDIWNWSLGDGTWQNITKSWANITDSYPHFGNYSIYLMVNNTAGVNDTIYSPQWINITESMKTNMTANITGGQQPLPVQFNDASTNATVWNWSFGDGLFSNSQNPVKIYNNFGLFDISLNASSSTSFNTTTFIDWINVTESMKTNMTANVTKGIQPLVVQFNDISTNATLWNWSFGDGTYSASQNPVKQFVSFGLYSISLNASSDTSFNTTTFTNWINVTESMKTEFGANITSGMVPLPVQFTDLSTNATIWNWSFGDTTFSELQNPIKVYTSSGIYNVALNASSDTSFNITTKTGYITVTGIPPNSSYTVNASSGTEPRTILFTDTSSYSPSTWNLSYGDGTWYNVTSTFVAQSHTYLHFGDYQTYMITNNTWGINSSLYSPQWINITESMKTNMTASVTKGQQPLSVQFNDISTNATLWNWSFGDGTYSESPNPLKQFVSFGLYTVSLNASTSTSYNTTTFTNWINVTESMKTEFSANITSGMVPLPVQFTDLSTNATVWNWSFGDGNFSNLQNPIKTYSVVGTFTVALNASSDTGYNTTIKTDYITTASPMTADFAADHTSGIGSLLVQFTDMSVGSPTSWNWSFGDGITSSLQNPQHNYITFGVYTVSLNASTPLTFDIEQKNNYITVYETITADFTQDTTLGAAPLTVTFTDLSNNATSWDWDYGDGTAHGNTKNPPHNYLSAGIYTVNLTASNAGDSDIISKTNLITVYDPILASFTSDDTSTCRFPPVSIQFNDTSSGLPTSWLWSFGDGGSSTVQNATHIYNNFGNFTVSLDASNTYTSDSEIKVAYICLLENLTANFVYSPSIGEVPLNVSFIDTSNNATSWAWDFGDGNGSILQNPYYVYPFAGTFDVTLTVDDAKGLTDSKTIIGAIKAYNPAEPHQVIQLPEKTRYYVDFYIWIIFFILVLGMIVISHVGKQDTLNIIFAIIGFLASIFVMYGSLGLAYYNYIPYNTTSNVTVYANNTTIHAISTEYISVIQVITTNWLTVVCVILLLASLINMIDIIGGYFERNREEL